MEEKKSDLTEAGILSIMDDLRAKHPTTKEDLESTERSISSISPYIGMTKEQMEKAIPEGYYDISGNGIVCVTGKYGFINSILKIQKGK